MQMITITSVEFQRNFGLYQDTAQGNRMKETLDFH